jgi:predicted Zn finger-like uncharacterized protein
MKIECDKCGAKYSIADDKVRGKTFKIRCKKCSNVIIVRDKAGGGDASESEAPADEPGWHLAIGGETVGPLTELEVRERHAAGEIDRDTSVWQEGFEDWLPLGDVPTFSDLTESGGSAGAMAPVAASGDPFSAGGDDYSSSGSSGGGFGGGDDFGRTAEPARSSSSGAASSVGSSGAASSHAAATPAAATPAAGDSPRVNALTSARNENSVLFSLDSLSAVAMGRRREQVRGRRWQPEPELLLQRWWRWQRAHAVGRRQQRGLRPDRHPLDGRDARRWWGRWRWWWR